MVFHQMHIHKPEQESKHDSSWLLSSPMRQVKVLSL
jgi:hypothetical protein